MEIDDKKSLERFIVNNPELEDLENKVSEFNIFEAMGAVRQELRHSDFLAFMLDPSEKHGLGDTFLKRFLMRVLTISENVTNVSAIDIDIMDLSNVIVLRESMNIDILIHDTTQGFFCIIENKIYSGEHSNQLQRYIDAVEKRFGKPKTLIAIFLSPEGTPTIENASGYIAVPYRLVQDTLAAIRQANQASLGLPVGTMIDHYITMLRRHIVKDSDIVELCRKIYRQHKHALELIFEHKPDIREPIANLIVELIRQQPDLEIIARGSSEIQFIPRKWKNIPAMQSGTGEWSQNSFLMRFSITFYVSYDVFAHLTVGPGKLENVRQKLYQSALDRRGQPFTPRRTLGKKWSTLYKQPLVSADAIADNEEEGLLTEIQSKWAEFIREDFASINEIIDQITFDAVEY